MTTTGRTVTPTRQNHPRATTLEPSQRPDSPGRKIEVNAARIFRGCSRPVGAHSTLIYIELNMFYMEPLNPPAAAVAGTLRQLLEERGLSRREVAELSGVSLATLNRHLDLEPEGLQWDEIRTVATMIGRSASDLIKDSLARVPRRHE